MIDAICIDQLDDNDKGPQRALMAHIYRRAQVVWAWLGCYDDDAYNLLYKIIEVAEIVKDHDIILGGAQDLLLGESELAPQFGLPVMSDPAWENLLKLLQCNWFKRLWVVQEAVLAQELAIVSGHACFSPATIYATSRAHTHVVNVLSSIDLRFSRLQRIENPEDRIWYLREIYHENLPQIDFTWAEKKLAVLTFTATSQECREPRDRIFGLMGLIDNETLMETHGLLDVTKSPAELFTAATHLLLTTVQPTDGEVSMLWWNTLHLASAPGIKSLPPASKRDADKGRGGKLPSWVPNYAHLSPGYLLWASLMATVESAASQQCLLPRQVADIYTLVVRGIAFDTVAAVMAPMLVIFRDGSDATRFIYWETMTARKIFGRGQVAEVSVEAYWRLLSTRYARPHTIWSSSSLPTSGGGDLDYASFCDLAATIRATPEYIHVALVSDDRAELLAPSPYEVGLDDYDAMVRAYVKIDWSIFTA